MTISAIVVADSRAEAVTAGVKRYRGTCKHHGPCVRWTSNATCLKCTALQAEQYRLRNSAKLRVTRRRWADANPIKAMLQGARARAKKLDVPFDLVATDIQIPDVCPVLRIPLARFGGDFAPTIDRIRGDLGYVKGNVVVVSFRANRIKNDASIEELRKVVVFYENLG